MKAKSLPIITFEHKRDAYGFAVRPQHLQRYREYASIYKEEEEERSDRWNEFLESQVQSNHVAATEESGIGLSLNVGTSLGDDQDNGSQPVLVGSEEAASQKLSVEEETTNKTQIWSPIRPSLAAIEQLMSYRVKKKTYSLNDKGESVKIANTVAQNEETKPLEDSEDEFYDVERSDVGQEVTSGYSSGTDSHNNAANHVELTEPSVPWKEELEFLVRGGLPMALRGEIWQAFAGIGKRRVQGYYQNLLADESTEGNVAVGLAVNGDNESAKKSSASSHEKWKGQIEKDLPRTFPGHPALDEDGRNALRRLLTAYARHNPSVGYCQAMNFFAGLLLLLMPEENAFWTLMAIIDDYFDGYYSEEMIESQVDQLVLEELVSERFPKLCPALVTTKDAGDAVTLLQSLAGSTFDSSQLVLTACMGYQTIKEARLIELRKKHRPAVIAIIQERAKGFNIWRDSHGLASKLYGFKHESRSLPLKEVSTDGLIGLNESGTTDMNATDEFLGCLTGDHESDLGPDLKEQVTLLKAELCRLLEEKRSAYLRADELEIALMEMVKQDNRRLLSARVEQLEQEVSELHQALADKQEQEQAMLEKQPLVARPLSASCICLSTLTRCVQEKYEEAMAQFAQMEKRAIMAETMLEATLQYQTSHTKAQQPSSPLSPSSRARANQDPQQEIPSRKVSLLSRPFGLVWRDRNKEKPNSPEEPSETKVLTDGAQNEPVHPTHNMNGHLQMELQ
ncbi:hypothetical protein HPP92_019291 [Vanilla planifolia]|uniref:Rab-GAP TBC domain-containing protein n=1 Tax=Vanilla planifolia TaxID=51239 RepID=A0A835UKL5_VANPL|nr:hypothetical protein HPP92_019291 [Vanilla planifolia]